MAEKSTGLYAYVSTGKSAGSTGPSTQLYSTLLIFLVWSTGPLLIIFGRPDGKLFLSPLPIIPWVGVAIDIHQHHVCPNADSTGHCQPGHQGSYNRMYIYL